MILGDHLKKRRLELNLHQKQVAKRLNVNPWTLGNWEKNRRTPEVRFIPRIIEFLGYYPFPEPETLAEKMIYERRMLGLSQKQLAKKLSVDEATVARWEAGAAPIYQKHRDLIQVFLQIAPTN